MVRAHRCDVHYLAATQIQLLGVAAWLVDRKILLLSKQFVLIENQAQLEGHLI